MNEPTSSPAQAAERRRTLQVASIVLGVALTTLVGLSFYEPGGQKGGLADGSRLELRGVTHDPGHTWVDGNMLQRTVASFPAARPALGAYRGTYPANIAVPRGPIVLWFRAQWKRARATLRQSAWLDPHGCHIPSGIEYPALTEVPSELPAGSQVFGIPRSQHAMWAVPPAVVPRRGSEPLTFVLFEDQGGPPAATYRIAPLPEPPDPPDWKGSPPPLSAVQGDTRFTLTELRHLPPGPGPGVGAGPFNRSVATFRYDGQGSHVQQWRPAAFSVTDAAGNRLPTYLYKFESRTSAMFNGLCVREPAWKLRVRFARPDPAAVPPDRVWTWRDVPAPLIKEETFPRLTFRDGSTQVVLNKVWAESFYQYDGPDVRKYLGGRKGLPGGFSMNLTAPDGCYIELLRIADQDGGTVKIDTTDPPWSMETSYYDPPEANSWSGHLLYRAGSRRLNFTFGLWRTRTVEYMVRP